MKMIVDDGNENYGDSGDDKKVGDKEDDDYSDAWAIRSIAGGQIITDINAFVIFFYLDHEDTVWDTMRKMKSEIKLYRST